MRPFRFAIVAALLILYVTVTVAQEITPEAEITEEVVLPPAEATEDISEPLVYESYTVRPGDTLGRIASEYRVSVRDISDLNDIANPSLIRVGQQLRIPPHSPVVANSNNSQNTTANSLSIATPLPPSTMYIVQEGDTLLSIARQRGTSIRLLEALNDFSDTRQLYSGQQIRVPSSGTPRANIVAENNNFNNTMFGTGIEIYPTGDVLRLSNQITELGVDWVKITVNWGEIEATQGIYDFSQLDPLIIALDLTGVDILLTLIGSPDWARPDVTDYVKGLQAFYGPPQNVSDFETFANAIATHYAGDVDAYEIWEAPNLRRNWINPAAELTTDTNGNRLPVNAGFAPIMYIELLDAGYRGVKDADENAKVLTAGLAPTGLNDFYNAIDTYVFLEALLEQGALDISDAIGVHIDGYGNTPDAICCNNSGNFTNSYYFYFQNVLDGYRAILDRNDGRNVALWVTELGWGTPVNSLSQPSTSFSYFNENTPVEQADYLVSSMAMAETTGYVSATIVNNLNACIIQETSACYYSIIDSSGSNRPAYGAISDYNLIRLDEATD